jgi:hypothetical protein
MNKNRKAGGDSFLKLADFYIQFAGLTARDYTNYVLDFLAKHADK